jgi:hypothetical protein
MYLFDTLLRSRLLSSRLLYNVLKQGSLVPLLRHMVGLGTRLIHKARMIG